MANEKTDEIVRAYDEALNEICRLHDDFCRRIFEARAELHKARREALKKAQAKADGA